MAASLLDGLLSLVVPPLCAVCREPELSGTAICPACAGRLVALPAPRCGRCAAPVVAPVRRCMECRGRSLAFRSAWAPFAYEATARRIVVALKARGATRVAGFMAGQIASRAPPAFLEGTLVPVPEHPARRRREGLNQAAALAGALARVTGLPIADALARRRSSTPQVGLAKRDRIANARGSVAVRREPPTGRLLLVDDVYTTGATLDACARALAGAGGRDVAAVTFARALR
jgi:predicted amidophosphoribosyltransferase